MIEITKSGSALKTVTGAHGIPPEDIDVYAETDMDKSLCRAKVLLIQTKTKL